MDTCTPCPLWHFADKGSRRATDCIAPAHANPIQQQRKSPTCTAVLPDCVNDETAGVQEREHAILVTASANAVVSSMGDIAHCVSWDLLAKTAQWHVVCRAAMGMADAGSLQYVIV